MEACRLLNEAPALPPARGRTLARQWPTRPAGPRAAAAAYHELGDVPRAIPLFEQLLADRQRVLGDARRVVSRGGWTGLDRATIEAVRGGAQPGDPLPPLQAAPYIRGVTDTEVIITGTGQGRRVAVLFSYTDFPGVRFGHRFPPGLDGHGDPLYLMEEIETGALDRMMQTPPPADTHGITWTTWGDPVQEPE